MRREQLGLSREELALRAGMAPSYVRYIEEQSDSVGTGPLLRLAAALRTTARQLLGAEPGPRPARRGAVSRPSLRDLGPGECWDHLAEHELGRVALSTADGPAVLPVNYTLDGRAVVYRSGPGRAAAAPEPGTEVAFEVDQVDEVLGTGWSVLVVGRIEYVTSGAGERVRINPVRITGRIVRAE
jgi:transcriptional regulator with XRE-family HTH domain